MSDMLVEYAATRDLALRNQLAERHLPLVKFVARKMSSNLPGNVDLDDLVSWGAIGLIDAIEKFEPERGWQFSTYAVQRIRGEILDGLQRMEWAPKQVTSQVRRFNRAVGDLRHDLGRDPTVGELAERLEVSEDTVRAARLDNTVTRLKPLTTFTEDLDGGAYSENPLLLTEDADQEVAGEVAEIRSRVAGALEGLEDQERRVLFLYYADNLTLREIAAQLGLSVSSATQAHTRLVDRIRRQLAERHGAVA